MAIWDPRHNSDHFMVMGSLCGASLEAHYLYLGSRKSLPLRLSGRQMRTWADDIFFELRRAIPKPDKWVARHNSWLSAEMWRLADERDSMRRDHRRDQQRLRQLGRAIQASLKEDRLRRAKTAGEEVEILLTGDPPLPR